MMERAEITMSESAVTKLVTLECPCCGDDAWAGHEGDEIQDGTAPICGCTGWISCDRETDPWVNVYDCDCELADG